MASKGILPGPMSPEIPTDGNAHLGSTRLAKRKTSRVRALTGLLIIATTTAYLGLQLTNYSAGSANGVNVPVNAEQLLDRCRALDTKPSVPSNFYERQQSDRFEAGTKPTLITVKHCELFDLAFFSHYRTRMPLSGLVD